MRYCIMYTHFVCVMIFFFMSTSQLCHSHIMSWRSRVYLNVHTNEWLQFSVTWYDCWSPSSAYARQQCVGLSPEIHSSLQKLWNVIKILNGLLTKLCLTDEKDLYFPLLFLNYCTGASLSTERIFFGIFCFALSFSLVLCVFFFNNMYRTYCSV